MTIPRTVTEFLERHAPDYAVVHHPYTATASHSAEAAHVSGERIAKAVLLEDTGGFLLAVLPATHTLHLARVREITGRDVELAAEDKLPSVFHDCAPGAVPSLGRAYGVETIVDEALLSQPVLYFEAGTHEDLVCVEERCFEGLMGSARRFGFSAHKH